MKIDKYEKLKNGKYRVYLSTGEVIDTYDDVILNKDLLLKYISDNNYDDPEELNKFKVKIYPNEKRGYIEFLYFNDTMLTSFKYYGFYYSFDGKYKELDLPEAKNKLKKNGKGYYYHNGDDSLYTEKIIDNFYYYKMMY